MQLAWSGQPIKERLMFDQVQSVHGVPIRLTQERWQHITEARDELIDRADDVLDAVQAPDWVTKGYRGSLVAWKGYGRRGYLAVIYKELDAADGFIITAFFTKKPKKRGKIWPK
jgi:hypothetical protein